MLTLPLSKRRTSAGIVIIKFVTTPPAIAAWYKSAQVPTSSPQRRSKSVDSEMLRIIVMRRTHYFILVL